MTQYRGHVVVCGGHPCVAAGCTGVRNRLELEIREAGLEGEIKVITTGCLGPCHMGPFVVVYPDGSVYQRVSVDDVPEIVQEHLLKGRRVDRLLCTDPQLNLRAPAEAGGATQQQRIVLENVGLIDPESIEEYIARDGYLAEGLAYTRMVPSEIVNEIERSGLRGRGGAAFPTGRKLAITAAAKSDAKYVVCNADEGEPGTFKDRLIMEGDPHRLVEAMAIVGRAIGATEGYVYIRGEYLLSISRVQKAIDRARELGLLGSDIFGSGHDFDIQVRTGAGAYVCGEETALLSSMEGKRGEPRVKPPYPGERGLWGKPTAVCNVETLANIPSIIRNGADWFRGFGTPGSPGTKVFTLTGNVAYRGLIEVPFGISLRQVIYGLGGGIPGGRRFKMAQTGGTSGGILTEAHLDAPLDYDGLREAGSAVGSGALLVIDDSHCAADIAYAIAKFFEHESCGRCSPCRLGTRRIAQIFEAVRQMRAGWDQVELALDTASVMTRTCLCALGQSLEMPLTALVREYRDDFEAHMDHECAGCAATGR